MSIFRRKKPAPDVLEKRGAEWGNHELDELHRHMAAQDKILESLRDHLLPSENDKTPRKRTRR